MGLKKRGGISVYIIIAVVIIISSILLFSLYDTGDEFKKDIVPSELRKSPIISFVDECIKDTTFNGIKQLSMQAGHLNPQPGSANPMKSNGVYLSDVFVPYWYYIDGNQFKSNMPPLYKKDGTNSIEEQLTEYVTLNLPLCINNFELFKDEFIVEDNPYKIDIIIRERDILINVLYPMDIISRADNSKRFESNFNTILDINLNEVYNFAKEIVQKEMDLNFIEQHVLNVISIYSGLDSELPPMSEVTIGSNELKYWSRTKVEEIIKEEVLEFIRLIQFMNAKDFNPVVYADYEGTNKLMQGIYAAMNFKVSDKVYQNIAVDLMYPSTDIYLNIGGKELIMPKNRIPIRNFITDMMRLIIYDYSFEYDLTFPVIASLKVENAYKGQDLIFRLGMQANIRNNIPLSTEFEFDDIIVEPIYGFSDQETFVYNFVFVQPVESHTGFSIDEVDIHYSCGQEVFIDKTFFGYVYDILPFCMFGGKVIARHPDYATAVYPYNNQDDSDEDIIIEMDLLKELEVEVRKIELKDIDLFTRPLSPLYNRNDLIYENSKPLGDNERALITINKIKNYDEESDVPFLGYLEISNSIPIDHSQSIINQVEELYATGNITLQEKDSILAELSEVEYEYIEMDNVFNLVPGNYTYNGYIFYEDEIVLPEKVTLICPCLEVMGICACERENISMPELKLNTFPIGNADSNITISNNLYTSEKIIFYVFVDEVPNSWDDFENLKQADEFSEYNYLLQPMLK
jgi:hypothetical protein